MLDSVLNAHCTMVDLATGVLGLAIGVIACSLVATLVTRSGRAETSLADVAASTLVLAFLSGALAAALSWPEPAAPDTTRRVVTWPEIPMERGTEIHSVPDNKIIESGR